MILAAMASYSACSQCFLNDRFPIITPKYLASLVHDMECPNIKVTILAIRLVSLFENI